MSLDARDVARGADLVEYLKLEVFDVTGRGVTAALATRALRAVVAHHDALRTRLTGDARVALDLPVDAVSVPAAVVHDGTSELDDVLIAQLPEYRPDRGSFVRIGLVEDVVAGRTLLVLAAHHLVCDLISWQILCRDLDLALDQVVGGRPVELPARSTGWAEWARAVTHYEQTGRVLDEIPYWTNLPWDRVAGLPLDHPSGVNSFESRDGVLTRTVWPDGPSASQAGPIVITALAEVLARWQGTDTVLIDTRSHGRHVPELGLDVSSAIGSFTLAHPLLLRLPAATDAGSTVAAVTGQLRAVPLSGLGFGLLRRPRSGRHEVVDGFPQAQVLLDYHGGRFWHPTTHARVLRPSDVALRRRPRTGGRRPYVLRVHADLTDSVLTTHWEFSEHLHDMTTVSALARAMADRTVELALALA
jgi:hypothetical protein